MKRRTIADFFGGPKNVSEMVVNSVVDVDSDSDAGDNVNTAVSPVAKKKAYTFRREWLKDFEWLRFENGTMHCVHCKAFTA